jgi:hypothetical protein
MTGRIHTVRGLAMTGVRTKFSSPANRLGHRQVGRPMAAARCPDTGREKRTRPRVESRSDNPRRDGEVAQCIEL